MQPVRDYELRALFLHAVEILERLGIPYMVVGGFAAILHGQPRLTLDVDIVVDMRAEHIAPLAAAFPMPDYYADEEAMQDALRRRLPFNIIQPSTGAKLDLVPLTDDPLTQSAFARRERTTYDAEGHSAAFICAEDILLAKLRAYKESGSDKHFRDALGIWIAQRGRLDLQRIRRRASRSELLELLEQVLRQAASL